jgi:hypothetical protein
MEYEQVPSSENSSSQKCQSLRSEPMMLCCVVSTLVALAFVAWRYLHAADNCYAPNYPEVCSRADWPLFYAERTYASAVGYEKTYCSHSEDDCATIDGFPGNNLLQYASWKMVAEDLKTLPARLDSGEVVRLNELGWQRLSDSLWLDDYPITGYKSILLALNLTDQAFFRPIADQLFAMRSKVAVEDGVRDFIADSMKNGPQVADSTQKLLHKVVLGLDISEMEASELSSLQTQSLVFLPFAPSWVTNALEPVLKLRNTRKKWIERYLAVIEKNPHGLFPDHLSNRQAYLIASAISDTMIFAGGFSIQQGFQTLLALMYQKNSPVPTDLDAKAAETVVWEALRLYPLVGALPYWDLKEQRHVWPNLFMAMWDKKAWGHDAMEYRLRPLEVYKQKAGIAFGEPAKGRGCPGQELTIAILTEFVLKWPRSAFKTEDDIQFSNTAAFYPAFSLEVSGDKEHHTGKIEQRMFLPPPGTGSVS